MTRDEAKMIIGMVDVSWQDVPLREETIGVWASTLPSESLEYEHCVAAINWLLHTSARRPSYAELITEAHEQRRAAREAEERRQSIDASLAADIAGALLALRRPAQ